MSQNNYNFKILEALLRSENHIRGMAKLLNTNQTTIARKVAELHEQNVLDYKTEGKNKVFFIKKTLEAKQYVHMEEMNKLVQTVKKYALLRRIIEHIQKNDKIALAILFGSYAKGEAKENSDIDIYIDTKNKAIKEEVEKIDSRIDAKIGNYNKDSLLIREIEKNHVVIKGAELFYEKNKFFS